MLAKDLRINELVQRDPKTGFPQYGGQRLLITGVATLKRFYEDLYNMIGPERSRIIFTRMGYDNGLAGGLALKNMYEFETPTQLIKALPIVTPMVGMAREVNSRFEYDPEKNIFNYTGEWTHSFESLIWNLHQKGPSHAPLCHMLCGLAAGYFSAVIGRDVLVKELSCRAQGNEFCRFEARPIEEWDEEKDFFHEIIRTDSLDEELEFLRSELNRSQQFLQKQQQEIQRLKQQTCRPETIEHGIIYRSPDMAKLIELAEIAAPNDSTILIQGESGTGKELIARYIHECSKRSDAPFLAINCAAIPATLIESELFGHEKGAFTGAEKSKPGLFIQAGSGTIFLDEIGELPFEVQAKLLRVLQQKEVMPLGSVQKQSVTARTIAATNQDLQQMVADGKFRKDLFYRVSVFPLFITPLRQRREDILILARHFLSRLNENHPGFTPEAVRRMQRYNWPGNIRELENCVEYAFILSRDTPIQVEHLPVSINLETDDSFTGMISDFPSPKELIRRYAKQVVGHTEGNKTKAAQMMGISIPTLWRYLKP
ncbi:MAG: sigma 54-interacting transcriptional regulator [Pseudomonadota bacterium]